MKGAILFALLAFFACAAAQNAASKSSSRKLLQPFDLGLQGPGRRSGNVGNTGERRTNAVAFRNAGLTDTGRLINNTIRASTSSIGETTNLNFGGAGKVTYRAQGNTTNSTAETLTGVDARSIGLPGPGVTAARVIDRSDSLASRRIKPPGTNRNASTLREFEGPSNNVNAGSWANLGAATLDYGFAGDYDYSIITALVDDRSFYAYVDTYDDDGGQLAAVPGTGAVTSRTATKLDDERQRATSFGRLATTGTGKDTVARGLVVTAGSDNINAAKFKDDIFGTGTVFVPPNQFRQVGGSASGAGLSRNYRGNPLPGAATNLLNAGSTVSRNYVTGAASDQLNYAHGTQGVSVRSQNVALSGSENVDFDVGRRRRLQAARHHGQRHRMHAIAAGKQ